MLTLVRPSMRMYSTWPVLSTPCSSASSTFRWCAKTRSFPPVILSDRMPDTCLRKPRQARSNGTMVWVKATSYRCEYRCIRRTAPLYTINTTRFETWSITSQSCASFGFIVLFPELLFSLQRDWMPAGLLSPLGSIDYAAAIEVSTVGQTGTNVPDNTGNFGRARIGKKSHQQ